jgi:hypothetical protein
MAVDSNLPMIAAAATIEQRKKAPTLLQVV